MCVMIRVRRTPRFFGERAGKFLKGGIRAAMCYRCFYCSVWDGSGLSGELVAALRE